MCGCTASPLGRQLRSTGVDGASVLGKLQTGSGGLSFRAQADEGFCSGSQQRQQYSGGSSGGSANFCRTHSRERQRVQHRLPVGRLAVGGAIDAVPRVLPARPIDARWCAAHAQAHRRMEPVGTRRCEANLRWVADNARGDMRKLAPCAEAASARARRAADGQACGRPKGRAHRQRPA